MEDKELIIGLQNSNPLCFEKIFSKYHQRVYNFCRGIVKYTDEAEEIVQRVFVALWEQRELIDCDKNLGSYLFAIAKYIAYRELRKQVFKQATFDSVILGTQNVGETTEENVLFRELKLFLDTTIEELPERQREIFILSRQVGLTYRQIAEKLNISENTVDTQLRRANKTIRTKYNEFYS